MLTWLPLLAKAVTSLPSTTRLTRVSRPTQCAVGPSLKSNEEQCIVTTHATTSVAGFLGWVPCCLDPPLGSLNVPCATCGKSPSEGNPSQNGQMRQTQNTCVPYIENGPLLGSCACSVLLFDQTQAFPTHETWDLEGTAPLPQEWPPFQLAWDISCTYSCGCLWTQNRFSESVEAASPPASLQGYTGC